MKNVMLPLLALIALFAAQTNLNAQKTATWKGGTPGRPSDWNCSTNWKEGRTPDEFSNVIIPDVSGSTFSYPVIEEGEVEIQSLFCSSTAKLTVKPGANLIVLEPLIEGKGNGNRDATCVVKILLKN